jgi:hypothetical protein
MNKAEKFKNDLVKLKSDIIDEIRQICNGRELEFKRTLIYRESDDQFSETFYRINKDNLIIADFDGFDYPLCIIDGVDIRDLLIVLEELEEERYFVYEESEEE